MNAAAAADLIVEHFEQYSRLFAEITRRSRSRFESEDLAGAHADARERLELYPQVMARVVGGLVEGLGERILDRGLWAAVKPRYSKLLADRDIWEIGETFFNSVTRRVFSQTGVDPVVEFVATDFAKPPTRPRRELTHRYEAGPSGEELIEAILTDYRFGALYEDIRRDTALIMKRVNRALADRGIAAAVDRAEMVIPVFFRGQGAYIVGRLFAGAELVPLVIALRNQRSRVVVDAVLLDDDSISILFGVTRSHFHVASQRAYELVEFLQTLMPSKRPSELYSAVGFHKHGKTLLFREILEHLGSSQASFVRAPGARGLVMIVFTMPDLDLVFKIMRDRFGPPKRTTPRSVREKYDLVFKHDRAGRLIDAHEFEHLQLNRKYFSAEMLDELIADAGSRVSVVGDSVNIDHVYIERKVTPLDVHVRSTDPPETAMAAVLDYGCAIKDLAASDIFPGDLLIKNFGLTRHGRVVFYDYDELAHVTDCVFKPLPEPQPDNELAARPMAGVGPDDMFPEEFRSFLGLPKVLREGFEAEHAELFDPEYWRSIQQRLAEGDLIEILPYAASEQLSAG